MDTDFWMYDSGLHNKSSTLFNDKAFKPSPDGLILQASYVDGKFVSGRMVSRRYFRRGSVEIVAKLSYIPGSHVGFWLQAPNRYYQYGEIDVLESIGRVPDTGYSTVYYGDSLRSANKIGTHYPIGPGFHRYFVRRSYDGITIRVDGRTVMHISYNNKKTSSSLTPLEQPMRLLVGLVMGTKWAGRVDVSKMPVSIEIASIKTRGFCINKVK